MNPITTQIVDLFQQFRMPVLPTDQYESVGKSLMLDKIDTFVSKNVPVEFVMLGYPFKSFNDRDKVIGKLPDMGEEVSLKNFNKFDTVIKTVYRPGVRINIVSDGYAFNELYKTPDSVVASYEEINRELSKDYSINWFDMRSFYDNSLSLSEMRQKVLAQFGITPEELTRRILIDADVNNLYRGMMRFLGLDLAILPFPSNKQLQKEAKRMAREMMLMNEAYSALIAKEFKSYVRLSMHPSINNGAKYSFQLIPGPKSDKSPWHCALLINKDGQYETVHRRDAEAAGYELVYKDGRPYYFIEN